MTATNQPVKACHLQIAFLGVKKAQFDENISWLGVLGPPFVVAGKPRANPSACKAFQEAQGNHPPGHLWIVAWRCPMAGCLGDSVECQGPH
jgi:hypothetical protein